MVEQDYNVVLENDVIIGPRIKTKFPDGGLGYFIINACDTFSNSIYQSCPYENKSITFNDFKIRSLNVAANVKRSYGIQKGDVIMTCMKNSLENALPVAAAFFLAGISCSIDPTLSIRDCEHLVNLVKPKIIFLDQDSLQTITATLKNINFQSVLVVNENLLTPASSDITDYITLSQLTETDKLNYDFKPAYVEATTPAAILFSSGTTGLPKGICLSHKAMFYASFTFLNILNNPRCFMYLTTFYWISGLLMFIGQFLRCSTRISLRQFQVEFVCQVIEKYKIESAFFGSAYVTKIFQMKNFTQQYKYNISSLNTILLGGSLVTKEQVVRLHQTFPQITFCNGYGMTETGGPCTSFLGNYRQLFQDFPESVGTAVPGTSFKIVDLESEKPLKANEKGEIRMKSDFAMIEYCNNTTDNPFDSEGFIKSGDIGYYDERKYLYITGRFKDMFKYQSWHIVPASIEAIILEHPAVEEAIVFGIPHDEDGFLPSAVITLKKSNKNHAKSEDIAKFVAERVADRQKLRGGVYIMEHIPKTPTGKVQRIQVQEMVMKSIIP